MVSVFQHPIVFRLHSNIHMIASIEAFTCHPYGEVIVRHHNRFRDGNIVEHLVPLGVEHHIHGYFLANYGYGIAGQFLVVIPACKHMAITHNICLARKRCLCSGSKGFRNGTASYKTAFLGAHILNVCNCVTFRGLLLLLRVCLRIHSKYLRRDQRNDTAQYQQHRDQSFHPFHSFLSSCSTG